MKLFAIVPLVVAAIALCACGGESKADAATSTVCDARADIAKQVDSLSAMTAQTFTLDSATASLKAIRDDLSEVAGAQGDLSQDRRAQVQAANQQFKAQVQQVAGEVGRSLGAGEAKDQLTAAFDDLASTYRQTFAKVDCGS